MGDSVDDFFECIKKSSDEGARLPNWWMKSSMMLFEGYSICLWYRRGELYLEFHRGTYTSHGSIKKGNRKSEILMRDIEVSLLFLGLEREYFDTNCIWQHVATLASIYKLHKIDYVYPRQRINDNWEKVLLNQCMFLFYFVLWRSLHISYLSPWR